MPSGLICRIGFESTLSLLLLSSCLAVAAEPPLKVTRLHCEHLERPAGIDVATPLLSWVVESAERGQRQTAFQVMVGNSAAELAKEHGDLWDSGKVTSSETTDIEYAGKPLVSHQYCYWKVRVWDAADQPTAWTEPEVWSIGLLKPEDWKAEWIGNDARRTGLGGEADFGSAKWIWYAADPRPQTPVGTREFQRDFSLPKDATIASAALLLAVDNRADVALNGTIIGHFEGWEAAEPQDVAKALHPGANSIHLRASNDAVGPAGVLARLTIKLADGAVVEVVSDSQWRSFDRPKPADEAKKTEWPATALPHDAAPVAMLGEYGMKPWGKARAEKLLLPPPALLRGEFDLQQPLRRATLYVSALGACDTFLNGKRVSDDRFTPGWTDYPTRVYYRAYDVAPLLTKGKNVIGAELADGWFSGYVGYGGRRDHYGKKPRYSAQLVVEYPDGTRTVAASTSKDWKTATGPTLEADLLMGESYDARLEKRNWCKTDFDAQDWKPVAVGCDEIPPHVQWHPGPPVQPIREFSPRTVTEPQPGIYVFDLGQNIAGVARLRARGAAGQKIQLRFAERLNPDGTIYTTNLRGARAVDMYICRGEGEADWEPRFTFHGFQYVEVTGLKEKPPLNTVVGIALGSATPVRGAFSCSDPMLNQLFNNVYWTQRANFIEVPTDCPQRDERLGWTGDAQAFVGAATLNCDVQPFFTKWLRDLADGQRADGQFPMVAPVKVAGDDGGPAWADAGVICPWEIYQAYGDRRQLVRQYPSMVKFVEFCRSRSTPELLPPATYHCFGDWLNIQAETPHDVIYMAYFARCADIVSQAAAVLGKADDSKKYAELRNRVIAAFNQKYVSSEGRIAGNTQTAYVLGLACGLLNPERAAQAAKYLAEDIAARQNHLSTGFVGTRDLMQVLSQIHRTDVAYQLLHNDTFPSWGFEIKNGATSIWERWDGWTPEKGFQDPGMNSFAHYAFGAVYRWMVENIGGIHAAEPGYRKILIAPQIDPRLTWAQVAYDSCRGEIRVHWRIEGGKLLMDVTVPANTTATVVLPAKDAGAVMESGAALSLANGISGIKNDAVGVTCQATSGVYRFAMPAEGRSTSESK